MLLGRKPAGPQTHVAFPAALRGLGFSHRILWDLSCERFLPECRFILCTPENLQFVKDSLNLSYLLFSSLVVTNHLLYTRPCARCWCCKNEYNVIP